MTMTVPMKQEILEEKELYQTSDLALATSLSMFFPIEGINRENPRKATFLFKRTNETEQLVENYWKGQLRVDPQLFFAQVRSVKARLYGE